MNQNISLAACDDDDDDDEEWNGSSRKPQAVGGSLKLRSKCRNP